MKRILHLAVWCYPRAWRARYGAELHGLIDDGQGRWSDLLDVICGGVTMRVSRSRRVLPVLALGVAGAVAGSLVTMARPARYESHGTIVMTPAGDNAHASRLQLLFERSLGSTFGPDVDARADIAVTQTSNANEIRIAYRHADPQQAQETLQTLMSRIIEANLDVPSPPGRPGVQLKVTSPSDLPAAVSRPLLGWLAALGAAAGTLMGVVIGAVGRATRATPNS